MKTYKIAAIPGDGIGTDVIAAGIEVLVFEPIHGSALDIVGKGIANPIATF